MWVCKSTCIIGLSYDSNQAYKDPEMDNPAVSLKHVADFYNTHCHEKNESPSVLVVAVWKQFIFFFFSL